MLEHTAARIMPASPTERDRDRDLVLRYLDGEMIAFEELMARHERQVYRLCFRFVRNRDDAMDLAQEVFIKAFENLPAFRGDSRFTTWLYRVTVNHCLNHVKKHSREFVEVTEDIGRIDSPVYGALLEEERRELVRNLMRHLPPKQKVILELRMHDNLSYEEIAAVLGRSVSTIKSSVFFALAKLKKLVQKQAANGRSL